MKHLFFTLTFTLCAWASWASAGAWETGLKINGTTYWEGTGGNPFNNISLNVEEGGSLLLDFAYVKTFKNSGWDVCGARIFYSVYPAAGSPSFAQHDMAFGFNIGSGGDQEWNTTGAPISVNLANGLSAGSYKISFYAQATTGSSGGCGTPVFSNLPSNAPTSFYTANLTVTAPAAVLLTDFSASVRKEGIGLHWSTAFEVDHDYFEVERKNVQQGWTTIAKLAGEGSTTVRSAYQFTDLQPVAGENTYRLKIVDITGKAAYSNTVRARWNDASEWSITPNPVAEALNLNYPGENIPESATIRVYNAQGVLVMEKTMENLQAQTTLEVSALVAGWYVLEINGDGQRVYSRKSFVKQ